MITFNGNLKRSHNSQLCLVADKSSVGIPDEVLHGGGPAPHLLPAGGAHGRPGPGIRNQEKRVAIYPLLESGNTAIQC